MQLLITFPQMLKELIRNQSEIKKHLLQSSFLHKILQEQKGMEWKLFMEKNKASSILLHL